MTTRVSSSVLANTAVAPGLYGGANTIPVIIVDQQGRLTSASNTALSLPVTGVSSGTYGGLTSSTNAVIPSFTVDSQGRISFSANSSSITANTLQPQFISLGVGTPASGLLGEIRATDEVTAYYTSDERLKENVEPIENALEKIKQLKGVMFDWKDDYISSRGGEDGFFVRKHDTGLIAQEVEKVLPEVVVERENGYKAVRYEKLAGLIIQAINELSENIDSLKNK